MAITARADYLPSAPPYPYPSPPPPDRPNNSETIGSKRRNSFTRCICNFVLILLLVTVTISIIVWLIYWYRMESPKLPEFKVESATVSQLNTEGSLLTATWDISLLATNPNRKYKMSYDHDHVRAKVAYYYGDTPLLLGITPPLRLFALKERNRTRIDIKLGVVRAWFGDVVLQQISYDRSRGSVRFGVAVRGSLWFEARLVPPVYRRLKVFCGVDVGFSGNNVTGVLTSQSRCSVS